MGDSAGSGGSDGGQEARSVAAHALGELAARVGNELNNPLAAVLSAHQYLRARIVGDKQGGAPPESDPRIAHFFELVERELGTMTRVVDDLRVFGAPPRISRSTFLLRDLIEEVTLDVRRPPGITLENEVPEALAPVHLDRDACRRALVQLVRNAVESYDASAAGRVIVEGCIEGDEVILSVRDQGAGIPAELLDRVREPLFGTKARGTGLGLAIAEAQVRGQGGELACESEVGRGSTFTLRLKAR